MTIYNNKAPIDKAFATKKNHDFIAGLYLLATPIGNLQDISMRGLNLLRHCDILLCEDTRVTRKLLEFYQINVPKIISYHDHNGHRMRPKIIKWLQEEEKTIALVSDAGTPLISDPGYKLVKECKDKQIPVYHLPGACAAITALVVSALPSDRFIFLGFMPRKIKMRQDLLLSVKSLPMTLIIYETALRLPKFLQELAEIFDGRNLVLARELTKFYEEVRHINLNEIPDDLTLKGEYVLVLEGNQTPNMMMDEDDWQALLQENMKTMRVKQAVQMVADLSGVKRQEVYQYALALKAKQDEE